jgi:excisionase family DNA binding protein
VDDAAEALSLGRTKVYGLLDAGLLPSVKIGRARRTPRCKWQLARLDNRRYKGGRRSGLTPS